MTEEDKVAKEIVKKWIWDCGDSLALTFVQSELLQQRIVEALAAVGWQIRDKHGRWITLPSDWNESENIKGREYRPLYALSSDQRG